MNKIIFGLIVLISQYSFANTVGTADWVVEAGVMLIGGQAGTDLYISLNAAETLDPLSTNYHQERTKENAFAKCDATYYRVDLPDGDIEWVLQGFAECQIKSPAGTTITE